MPVEPEPMPPPPHRRDHDHGYAASSAAASSWDETCKVEKVLCARIEHLFPLFLAFNIY